MKIKFNEINVLLQSVNWYLPIKIFLIEQIQQVFSFTINCTVPGFFFIILCIRMYLQIPESPVWLVAKGKIDKAEKALCWLRGWVEPETVKTEHLELVRYNKVSGIRSFADEGDCHHLDANYDNGLISRLAQLKNPSVYRPLRLVMAFFFFSNIVSLLPTKPFFTKIMTEIGIKDNQSLLMVRIFPTTYKKKKNAYNQFLYLF